jgi:monofunctional biosynthetic peptidoglycan transglycosylase
MSELPPARPLASAPTAAPPPAATSSGGWRDRLRRAARRLMSIAGVALVIMTAQVTFVRFVDPPATITMLQRAAATVGSEDGARWVDYRPLDAEAQGHHLPRMAVASEDGWFFQHHGFDLGQLGAVLRSLGGGGSPRGASTISQQTAKNLFLWQGRSYVRKALEVPYTLLLELIVPKERILELYLNIAETGPMTFGAEAGAQRWFSKPANELSAKEAARLISILPYPEGWNVSDERAEARAREIMANRVPFPGETGFDEMVEQAPARIGWSALLRGR